MAKRLQGFVKAVLKHHEKKVKHLAINVSADFSGSAGRVKLAKAKHLQEMKFYVK